MNELPDLQKQFSESGIYIDKVGIRDLWMPFKVLEKGGTTQPTTAQISCYIGLGETVRGAHMSRFLEALNEFIDKEGSRSFMLKILSELRKRLNSESSYIKLKFPFFIRRAAPVTKKEGYVKYNCVLEGSSVKDVIKSTIEVEVPYLSLCPCSKEISKYGAHNQYSSARVKVLFDTKTVWVEDIIDIVEAVASSRIYNLLKRPDEKFVTERSYENPKFVEDIARDIAKSLEKLEAVKGYIIVTEHEESIHQHNAVAVVRGKEYIP